MAASHPMAPSASACLADWLAYLEQLHPKHIELGLERASEVWQRLRAPRLARQQILIGGTNGKGSCGRCLEQLLLADGRSTALYSSPHLLRFNERIRLGGVEVGDQPLCEALARVEAVRGDISLTYFEFSSLAIFLLIAEQAPEFAILEVGLGGRLDVVNLIDAEVAMITNVALDHMDWLGDNREAIGGEKAGILRAGQLALCGEAKPPQSLLARAESLGLKLLIGQQQFGWRPQTKADSQSSNSAQWHWWGQNAQGQALAIKALADAQQLSIHPDSAALALQTLASLDRLPDIEQIQATLSQLQVPGRQQWCYDYACPVLLDVGHNDHALQYLAEQVGTYRKQHPDAQCYALCSFLADKEVQQGIGALKPWVHQWHLCGLPGYRGQSAEQLAQSLAACQLTPSLHPQLADAMQVLLKTVKADDLILVFGSFFLVAEFYQIH